MCAKRTESFLLTLPRRPELLPESIRANTMSEPRRCPRRRWFASHRFRELGIVGTLSFVFVFFGCGKSAPPVTITILDAEGQGFPGDHRMIPDVYLQEFTRETGIRVNDLPTPEDNASKLALAMDLLRNGAPSPDIYGVDTIWAEAMGQYLIDLQPEFSAEEIAAQDRDLLESYRVQGKLVAMPYNPNVEVLFYRTDLLAKYGYKSRPGPGTSWRRWLCGFRLGNARKGRKIFGAFSGPARSPRKASS